MASIYETYVNHYTKKFNGLMNDISDKSIESIARSYGVSMEMLESGLKSNSKEFAQFCLKYASTLMPGHVSCCTYAAVVACIARKFGVPYKAYVGFCLRKDDPRYERDKSDYEARMAKGAEHAALCNHVYLEINGVPYEYYNGSTSDIEHLDVLVIAEG